MGSTGVPISVSESLPGHWPIWIGVTYAPRVPADAKAISWLETHRRSWWPDDRGGLTLATVAVVRAPGVWPSAHREDRRWPPPVARCRAGSAAACPASHNCGR